MSIIKKYYFNNVKNTSMTIKNKINFNIFYCYKILDKDDNTLCYWNSLIINQNIENVNTTFQKLKYFDKTYLLKGNNSGNHIICRLQNIKDILDMLMILCFLMKTKKI